MERIRITEHKNKRVFLRLTGRAHAHDFRVQLGVCTHIDFGVRDEFLAVDFEAHIFLQIKKL
jgi:hypothetical protein